MTRKSEHENGSEPDERRQAETPAETPAETGLPLVAAIAGMMLAGAGAALSAMQDARAGLAVALIGGAVCAAGGWRLIRTRR